MPFVYDLTEIEGSEDDPYLPPRADKFVYLPAPEYTGVRPPVGFSILPVETTELQRLAEPLPRPPVPRRSILDRLLGRAPSSESRQQWQGYLEEDRRRSRLLQEQRRQQLLSIMVPALRTIGVRRAYCRYDGGNDEGFAWLDRYEMEGGKRIEDAVLGQRLHEMNIQDKLYSAARMIRGASSQQEMAELAGVACDWLSHEWASILLGESFGTGEYLMYGAFAVDLDECIISDDPNAGPVVQNIKIAS